MGSPETDPDRKDPELPHRRVIPRRFAIATREVTVEQYQRFVGQNPKDPSVGINRDSPEPTGPMNGISWYEAAAYCNRLSQVEKIPEGRWCYEPREGEYAEGMAIPEDVSGREGYRLPTEAEWEYACRAGAVTSRYSGFSESLLDRYARYSANSRGHAWPCGGLLPNDLGLFDMLGNVYEWCQGTLEDYQPDENGVQVDIFDKKSIILNESRLFRGGAFLSAPPTVRSAFRSWDAPSNRSPDGGFRLARTLPWQPSQSP
jgi:formylglycine-generating enzyme required for sulfatase activity